MSYLFSWRGYWEMIWRWRLLVQSKPFFCSSWGREKMAVWHQGRQGRTSNVFTQAPRHLWSRRGTVLLHWAHVQKSESHYMYLVYVCVCLRVCEFAEQQQGDGKMWKVTDKVLSGRLQPSTLSEFSNKTSWRKEKVKVSFQLLARAKTLNQHQSVEWKQQRNNHKAAFCRSIADSSPLLCTCV